MEYISQHLLLHLHQYHQHYPIHKILSINADDEYYIIMVSIISIINIYIIHHNHFITDVIIVFHHEKHPSSPKIISNIILINVINNNINHNKYTIIINILINYQYNEMAKFHIIIIYIEKWNNQHNKSDFNVFQIVFNVFHSLKTFINIIYHHWINYMISNRSKYILITIIIYDKISSTIPCTYVRDNFSLQDTLNNHNNYNNYNNLNNHNNHNNLNNHNKHNNPVYEMIISPNDYICVCMMISKLIKTTKHIPNHHHLTNYVLLKISKIITIITIISTIVYHIVSNDLNNINTSHSLKTITNAPYVNHWITPIMS